MLISFFSGSAWLFNTVRVSELYFGLPGWFLIASVATGAAALILAKSIQIPDSGAPRFTLRLLVFTVLSLGFLATVYAIPPAHRASDHWCLLLVLYGAFSCIACVLTLVAWGGSSSKQARRDHGVKSCSVVFFSYLVILSVMAAVASEPRPERPWREAHAAEPAPSAAAVGPNVLFVSIDMLRSDQVHSYGYSRDTTPNLDRIASQGALFEQSIATSSWTLPSHSSLFTSRYPGELESFKITGKASLAKLFREHGYRTAAFTGGYAMSAGSFGEGFSFFADDYEDAYVAGFSTIFLETALKLRRPLRHAGIGVSLLNPMNGWRSRRGGRTRVWAGTMPSAKAAAEWIRDVGKERPFLLVYHTFGVHTYYLNTREVCEAADRWAADYQGWLRNSNLSWGSRLPRNPEDLGYLVALYDGAIRVTDSAVGEIVATLKEEGLEENTLVVVTSDHGEGFRPNVGGTWHAGRLHDDLTRVPLIMRMPGTIPPGTRISTQVSAVDVLPTIVDLIGLPAVPEARGRSMKSLVNGDARTPHFRRFAFSEVAQHSDTYLGNSVRSEEAKYIRTEAGGEEFYELQRDPEESRNLVSSSSPPLERFRKELDDFQVTLSSGPVLLDAETEEVLRELGYIGD